MAMMETMRGLTKVVIWIVVVGFVGLMVFQWGMDLTRTKVARGIVGEIAGEDITVEEYRAYLRQTYDRAASEGINLDDPEALRDLQDQAFNELIAQRLFNREIGKRGFAMSDQALLGFVRASPPKIIRDDPSFYDSTGQFDWETYWQFLSQPGVNFAPLESEARREFALLQLQVAVTGAARVTEAEAWERFSEDNLTVSARYVYSGGIPDSVSDGEVRAYYEAHPDEFQMPEIVRFEMVRWEIAPSEEDAKVALGRVREVVAYLEQGEDFSDLAYEYSDDPGSAPEGGGLGTFGRGRMVPEFDSAAFALPVGTVSDPVRTQYGYHIIEVTGRPHPDSVTARHILLSVKPSETTIEGLEESAVAFAEDARSRNFEQVAADEGLEVRPMFWEVGEDFVPGVGRSYQATHFLDDADDGDVSDPIQTTRFVFVMHALDKRPAGVMPFEEAQDKARGLMFAKKRRESAMSQLSQVAAALDAGRSLDEAASSFGLTVREASPIGRNSVLLGVGLDPDFTGALFGTPTGEHTGAVEIRNGAALGVVTGRVEPDSALFVATAQQLMSELMAERQTEVYNRWYGELREAADVKDYRDSPEMREFLGGY
jgi:peptidyl-prolyl cis-trans isomerase D